MGLGYNKPLYILPFDHRGSFQTKMFGWKGQLTPEQTAEIADTKRVVYDGFKASLSSVEASKAGILVDEQFGADILRDAKANGYITAVSTEKSGQEEFDFEYGDDFGAHFDKFDPNFSKVLVRYNSEGDAEMNRRQAERLKRLSDHLKATDRGYMFELLVPATKAQLEAAGDSKAYDRKLRPGLMIKAIHELQDAGVEADVWKIEGIDTKDDCAKVAEAARRNGRDGVGCIILGRGEDDVKVREWLSVAAGVPGFIGFAVGRTTFWDALVAFRKEGLSREKAASRIADNYKTWVEIFEAGL